MQAMDNYNIFLPTGSVKIGDIDYALDSNSMFDMVEQMGDIPLRSEHGNAAYLARRGHAEGLVITSRRTSCASTAGGRSTSPSIASAAPAR